MALLFVTAAGWWQHAAAQYYMEPIYSNNGMPWRGEHGPLDSCIDGSYTYALDFKVSQRRRGKGGDVREATPFPPFVKTFSHAINNR